MDPFTAALIISTVASIGTSMVAADNAATEQNRAVESQRIAQENQTRMETDRMAQRARTALVGASNRNAAPITPSYSGSVMGSIPSVSNSSGSSGTF